MRSGFGVYGLGLRVAEFRFCRSGLPGFSGDLSKAQGRAIADTGTLCESCSGFRTYLGSWPLKEKSQMAELLCPKHNWHNSFLIWVARITCRPRSLILTIPKIFFVIAWVQE